MALVVPAPEPLLLLIAGSTDRFPVRRVYCVGRNYAAHAREMGFDPDRDPPFYFAKPADALLPVAPDATLELRPSAGAASTSRLKTRSPTSGATRSGST
jgi:fumarylpyruvate hydrolase